MRLCEALSALLKSKTTLGRSPRTIERYYETVLAFASQINNPHIEDLSEEHILKYLEYKRKNGAKPGSIVTYYNTLSAFFNWCNTKYRIESPMKGMESPSQKKRLPDFLKDHEVKAMLAASKTLDQGEKSYAVLTLLLGSGIRAGELVSLPREKVDLSELHIRVLGKDQEERCVPLEPLVVQAIVNYWEADHIHGTWAFPGIGTDQFTTSGLRQLVKRCGRQAQVKRNVGPQLFRHTFGHNWMRNGGDLVTLKTVMGHSRISTTMRYVNTTPEDVREVQARISPVGRLLR